MICEVQNENMGTEINPDFAPTSITCEDGFTPGEIVISYFVFLIFTIILISFIVLKVGGVKIKNNNV